MNLPIRTFWLLGDCVRKLQAEEDLRELYCARAAQGDSEAFKSYSDKLVQVMTDGKRLPDTELDREGLKKLKFMMGQ